MVGVLQTGDVPGFMKSAAQDSKLLNARGPEGSTPFMYAVLYTGAPALEILLKQAADPNQRNDAGASALMWAASELEKTRALVAHGANVNARSSDMRTPLMIAARRPIVPLVWSTARIPIPTRIRPLNRRPCRPWLKLPRRAKPAAWKCSWAAARR